MTGLGHVLVVHRWRDRRAQYDRYVDHLRVDVSYVSSGPAASVLPETAAGVEVVGRTDDLAELAAAAGRLRRRFGAPDRIVALADGDRQAAAELRVLLGCPGETPQRRAPFAAAVTEPVAGAERVRLDGLWDGRRLLASRVARYLSGLVQPGAEGVVELGGGSQNDAALGGAVIGGAVSGGSAGGAALAGVVIGFAEAELAARLDRPATVHLEVLARTGQGQPELALAALTPWLPDDELPLVWQQVHGVDLLAAEFAVQLGEPLPSPTVITTGEVAGWLTRRAAGSGPHLIEAVDLPATEPAPYAAQLPSAGDRITGGQLARLRFRGPSTAAIERAIRQADRELVLRATPS